MDRHHPPNDPTPDQQRAARDKKWARVTSMHWHPYVPSAGTHSRAVEQARNAKPNVIPSQPPGGHGDQLPA